jgi:NADPH:quinone reductase-like Zn-dependent oxidoreductase
MRVAGAFAGRKVVFFIAKFNKADVLVLHDLLESGAITSALDRQFAFDDVADAYRAIGEGHARGKIVVSL